MTSGTGHLEQDADADDVPSMLKRNRTEKVGESEYGLLKQVDFKSVRSIATFWVGCGFCNSAGCLDSSRKDSRSRSNREGIC